MKIAVVDDNKTDFELFLELIESINERFILKASVAEKNFYQNFKRENLLLSFWIFIWEV